MEDYFEIKQLTDEDRKKLNNQFWLIIVFAIFVLAIFWFIFNMLMSFSSMSSIVPYIIFGVIALIFTGVIFYLFWSTYLDLKRGVKHSYTGVVKNKRLDTHTSTSSRHITRGGHTSSRTTVKKTYYLTLNDVEHTVSFKEYNQAHTGDTICLEVSPKKREILQFKILEKSKEDNKKPNKFTNNYRNVIKEQPAKQSDVDIVKKLFFKKLKKSLWFFAFPTIMLLLLWTTPSALFYLFTFPLFIVFLYQGVKLLVSLNNYAKFKNYKTKKIIIAKVLDKVTASSNKNSTKYRLVTDNGNIEVSQNIYQQIQPQQVIEMHIAKFLNITFGIKVVDAETETYYSLQV
ncbi:hypothetical protein [Confluentibacter sediminis]|uniref:hypothetical protein n=1 Tax=Confluentibacter sediminis TaxID=2219045 RepID=UPI000DAE9158|nr:hypothetical protein [Confluentibacter sediminis]